jgi:hypothetical protein
MNTDGETWQHWEIADQTKNVEGLYVMHERTARLRRAICRLQPLLRNVVEIHQSNDKSVKEIADLAGLSVAATKSRLLRAREPCVRICWKDERSNGSLFKKSMDKCSTRPGRRQCIPSRSRDWPSRSLCICFG